MRNELDDFFENGNQSYIIKSERSVVLSLLREDPRTKKYYLREFNIEKLSIDDVRIIKSEITLRLDTEQQRIIFIGAGTVSDESLQALLKLLEEPPTDTRVLFATTRVSLPKTIYSRAYLLKPLKQTESIGESDFFSSNSKDRLAIISALTKDPKDPDAARKKILSILNTATQELRIRARKNPVGTLENIKDVELISRLIHQKGTSAKMLLEHIALTI